MMHSSASLVLLLVSLSRRGAEAFAPSWSHHRTALVRAAQKDSPMEHDDFKGIEEARRNFEEIFQDASMSAQFHNTCQQNDAALTSAGRHRRQLEMALLDDLRESNDALDALTNLWINERDKESADRLVSMQEDCSAGLFEEEAQLREMMERFPNWAEPPLRLGVLYFFKGRTQESYRLALEALKLKPWHIEAPQLLIMICLRNDDLKQALYWARRSLPRMTESIMELDKERFLRRRQVWVENALEQAQKMLAEAEQSRDREERLETLSSALGAWQ